MRKTKFNETNHASVKRMCAICTVKWLKYGSIIMYPCLRRVFGIKYSRFLVTKHPLSSQIKSKLIFKFVPTDLETKHELMPSAGKQVIRTSSPNI